jgi:hypothetical protein
MASEDDFFVFRRFDTLNARTILWLQYHISRLEGRLDTLHKEQDKLMRDKDDERNASFEWDERNLPERRDIMVQLSGLLLQYSKHVLCAK